MDSERLGRLLGDLLGGEGAGAVPVRRVGPAGGYDLVSAPLREAPLELQQRVAGVVAALPEVATAEVRDGVLRVRLVHAVTLGALRSAAEAVPPVLLSVRARPFQLSGRAGLLDPDGAAEVLGHDVVAYALARAPGRAGSTEPLALDIDDAVRRTPTAPLFAVQWAHARAAALEARTDLIDPAGVRDDEIVRDRRGSDAALVASLLELPATVARAVRRDDPRGVPLHLEELARLLDLAEPERRLVPRGDERLAAEHAAGLLLMGPIRELLARGLATLGVGAPRRI